MRKLALMMLLWILCSAAGEVLAEGRKGSLTVVLPGAGGELKLCAAASVPPELQTPEYAGVLAAELSDEVGILKMVGEDGRAVFPDLSPGVYLVLQTETAGGYEKIRPFFVTVPMAQDDGWAYDISAYPKAGKIPEDDTNPDTGKAVPPVRLLCLSVLGLLSIMDREDPENAEKTPKEP